MGKKKHRRDLNHNRMYAATENKIQSAILKLLKKHRGRITARQVAEAAGLTSQTFYNHHPNINQAITGNEDILIKEFASGLDPQLAILAKILSDHNGRLFYAVIIFMAQRPDIFCPICDNINNQEILYRLLAVVYPRLRIDWLPKGYPAPSHESERVEHYLNVCVGILRHWGKSTCCNMKKANGYINSLLRVTANAAQNRL